MDLAANQISHEHEAGFVPPLVPSNTLPYSSTSSSNYTVTVTTSAQGLLTIFFVLVSKYITLKHFKILI